MKGLLVKDSYVLMNQMRMFLILAVVFAAIPGGGMNGFAVVYAAMLPYTAIAYDERSKWDHLAAMLPYSNLQIVLSKYILGYVCILCVTVVSFAVELLLPLILSRLVEAGSLTTLLPMACMGCLMLALTLPFMMRFGVEKGRMIFIFVMVAMAIGAANAADTLMTLSGTWEMLTLGLVLITLVANAVSIFLSAKLYPRRTC